MNLLQHSLYKMPRQETSCDDILSLNNGLLTKVFTSSHPHPNFRTPIRTIGYALLLVTKGKLNININFASQTLNQRELLLIAPNSVYEIVDNKAASMICIFFDKNYLLNQGVFFNYGEVYKMSHDNPSFKLSLSKEDYTFIYYNMLGLHKKLNSPQVIPQMENITHNSFLQVMYDIFLVYNRKRQHSPAVHDSKADLTNRFINLVAENFKSERQVIYYANALRITPRHLSQVVKQVTNRTASVVIDEMVIKEAKLLLTSHLMNISEVAMALSFCNSSFFGKYFKKHTGISPSAYKLSNKFAV